MKDFTEIETIARRLGCSTRTIRRNLNKIGKSKYSKLINGKLHIHKGYFKSVEKFEPKYFVLFSKTQDCHHVIRVEKFNRIDEREKGWELVSKREMTYEEADAFLNRRKSVRIEEYRLNIEFGKTESGNFIPRNLTVNGHYQDFNFLLWLGNSIMRVAQYQSDIDYTHQIAQPKKAPRKGYVYLMIDKNTGYHKIGFSKNPKHREKTLQSEKPTIELLHKFEGNLNQKDIDYIKTL
jgi:hypothetical protein